MEYNPPKLFEKVLVDEELPEKFFDSPLIHDLPKDLSVVYTRENGKLGLIFSEDWDKTNNLIEFDEFGIELTDTEYKKLCKNCFVLKPVGLLNSMNITEYHKLLELINQYSFEKRKSLKDDSDALAVLDDKIQSLRVFKKLFIKWFLDNNLNPPETEGISSGSDSLNISRLDRGDLTVKQHTELLVMEARNDEREGAYLEWKIKFFDEIGTSNLYPNLYRIRKKFKELA